MRGDFDEDEIDDFDPDETTDLCAEQWNDDVCATCGWKEPPRALGAIVDTVLKYRPTARSKPAIQRKRRKTILENKKKAKR